MLVKGQDLLPSSPSWSRSTRGAQQLGQAEDTGNGTPHMLHTGSQWTRLTGGDRGVGCTGPGFSTASQPKTPHANPRLRSGTF